MVGIFAKIPGNRSGRRSKQFLVLQEDRVGRQRINPVAAPHGVKPSEKFVAVEHPSEPPDVDEPVRCPRPEPTIMHDGRIWKERIAESVRRRNELLNTARERDYDTVVRLSSVPARRHRSVSNEKALLLAHSAPEIVVNRLLE